MVRGYVSPFCIQNDCPCASSLTMPSILYRRTKFIWTSFWNTYQKRFIEHLGISTSWRLRCRCWRSSFTYINCFALWHTFIRRVSAIVTSNLKTSCLTQALVSWSYVILAQQTTLRRLVIVQCQPFDIGEITNDSRCLVYWLCNGRVNAGATAFPRWIWNWSTGGDHKSPWNSHPGADSHHEPQLHGAQIPADQATPFQQSISTSTLDSQAKF